MEHLVTASKVADNQELRVAKRVPWARGSCLCLAVSIATAAHFIAGWWAWSEIGGSPLWLIAPGLFTVVSGGLALWLWAAQLLPPSAGWRWRVLAAVPIILGVVALAALFIWLPGAVPDWGEGVLWSLVPVGLVVIWCYVSIRADASDRGGRTPEEPHHPDAAHDDSRKPEPPEQPKPLLGWRERTLLLVALIALGATFVVYAGMNNLLQSFHQPGAPAYDLAVLGGLQLPWDVAGHVDEAVGGWRAFIENQQLFSNGNGGASSDPTNSWDNPLRLVFLITLLDSLMIVPAYAIALRLLARMAGRAIAADELQLDWELGAIGILRMLVVAVVADLLENLAHFIIIALAMEGAWAEWGDLVRTLTIGVAIACTWVKWGALAFAIVAIAVYWGTILLAARFPDLRARHDRGAMLLTILRRSRIPLCLLAVAFPLLRIPQTNEIMRRWQPGNLGEGFAALAAVGLFAAACWVCSRAANPDPPMVSASSPKPTPSGQAHIEQEEEQGIRGLGWIWQQVKRFLTKLWEQRKRPLTRLWAGLAVLAAFLTSYYWWRQTSLCAGTGACNSALSPGFGDLLLQIVRASLPAAIVLVGYPFLKRRIESLRQLPTSRTGAASTAASPEPSPEPSPATPGKPEAMSTAIAGALLPYLLAIVALVIVGLAAGTAATELLAYNAIRNLFEADNLALLAITLILLIAAALVALLMPNYPPGTTPPLGPDNLAQDRRIVYRLARLLGRSRRCLDTRGVYRLAVQRLGIGAAVAWGLVIVAALLDEDLTLTLWAAHRFGSVAIAFLGMTALLVILTAVVFYANDHVPRPDGRTNSLRLDRPPVLTLLALWLFLGANPLFGVDVHRIRSQRPPESPTTRPDLGPQRALDNWVADRCLNQIPPSASPPEIPLIFVAADGGGIRAAAWTTYVLNRTFGTTDEFTNHCGGEARHRSDFLFALSGISGGSVGIASEMAYLRASPEQQRAAQLPDCSTAESDCGAGWVETAFGDDHLASAVTWLLAVELPRLLLPVPVHIDRAAALERSVEEGWREAGLLAAEETPPTFFATQAEQAMPLMLLNAASVDSGCRFVASPLELNGRDDTEPVSRCIAPLQTAPSPGAQPSASPVSTGSLGATIDLVDLVCDGQDLPLATVAFISARFPYISPTANVEGCRPINANTRDPDGYRPQTYLVDGGYLEGSGAGSILGLYDALIPAIREYNTAPGRRFTLRPVLLTITNGYTEPSGPDLQQTPPQLTAPPTAFGRVLSGFSTMASQEAALRFTSCDEAPLLGLPQPGGGACAERYVRFALQAHPGPKAELGWTLSYVAFADFVDQYRRLFGPAECIPAGSGQARAGLGCAVAAWYEQVP